MFELLVSIVPTLEIPPPAAPPGSEQIMLIVSWVFWAAGIAGIIGFVILGISMAVAHRQGHGGPEFGSRIAYIFGGLILIGAAGGIVTTFLGV